MHKDLSAFKLYMSDVGLFVNKARYPIYLIDLKSKPVMISMDPLTENYVANELRINGIEVKSSTNTKARSLDLFKKLYHPKYAIRISEKNFGLENNIKSVPLYGVFCI